MNRNCAHCTKPMRKQIRGDTRRGGRRQHKARGLCDICWTDLARRGGLADYERVNRAHDDLLDDYVILRGQGYDWRQCAARLGMTRGAFERAMYRARRAGDPRAGRIGEQWPPRQQARGVAA